MKPSSILLPSRLEPDLELQFVRLAQEFASRFNELGLHVKVTRHEWPVEFRRASAVVKQRAIGYLEFNVKLLREMAASGEDIKDTKVYLWRALKGLQLVPPADILDHVHDEDIVEIYFLDEIQAFRNFRFLELTSYTIEEMLCRPWYRNTGRGIKPQMQLMAMVLKGKLGRVTKTTIWNVPEHELWEKDTEGNCHFMMKLKYFIPLRSDAIVVAFVSTNNSHLLARS